MAILYVGAIALSLVVAWLIMPAKAVWNDHLNGPKLRALLELLVTGGLDGARLRIQVREDNHRAISFRKYVNRAGASGVDCDVPTCGWPNASPEALATRLAAFGFEMQGGPDAALATERERLTISVGLSVENAMRLVYLLFEECGDWKVIKDCVAQLDNKFVTFDAPRLTGVRKR